jgi:hypothetical protein
MANPAAPHGLQPVQTQDGNPYSGKATLYHIQASDTLAYYNGDIVQLVPAAGANGSTQGSDSQGVPNITGYTRGASVTATLPIGAIVGVQVAPIGAGVGATQGNAVNLNQQFVPTAKLNDYYVWVADDPDLIFEIQGSASLAPTAALCVGQNASFLPTAPANVQGPLSATVVDTLAVTATLPLKVYGIPYRVNTAFGVNMPLFVIFNTHQYGKPSPGTAGV